MTATAAATDMPADAPPPKKPRRLILAILLLLLVAAAAGGGWFYYTSQHKKDSSHEAAPPPPKAPPTFLPLDSMVVNLADPAGDRMVQLAITIQLADAKWVDQIKIYLPTIRSNILLLVSQRTSQELLQREGKEQLAAAIKREVALPLGFKSETADAGAAKPGEHGAKTETGNAKAGNPVQEILFSSFIIQ